MSEDVSVPKSMGRAVKDILVVTLLVFIAAILVVPDDEIVEERSADAVLDDIDRACAMNTYLNDGAVPAICMEVLKYDERAEKYVAVKGDASSSALNELHKVALR